MSSAYAVSRVKKRFHIPCGHMGTLDPMAAGVLPVGIGKTSRLFPYLLDKEKTYVATFRFGILTDTLDITGKVIKQGERVTLESEVVSVLPRFIGEIDQIPPNYSAKNVGGKRGYELARKGVEFTLSPKKVTIINFTLDKANENGDFTFTIVCKGGTYIRSLARDVGNELNTCAVMTALERTACGIFNVKNSVTVEDFLRAEKVEDLLIPPENAVPFESLYLTEKQAAKILNGVYEDYGFKEGTYKVFCVDDFWGVGQVEKGKLVIKSYVR